MKSRTLFMALIGAFLLIGVCLAQQRPHRILLLYDMEGVTGATSTKDVSFIHKKEYDEARKSLTADVNAAIAGLAAAGASEIVVVDGHGSGNNAEPDVIEGQLLAPAKMISRDRPFDIYMDSYDQSIDAIVAIAMHAGAGNQVGFLSHTYTAEDIQYKVNSVPFNESMILAMGAARFKIPLIMVSGDDQLEKEIRRNLPWVKFACVKHAVGRSLAESFSREEASRRIEEAAKEALLAIDAAKWPEMPGPYRFTLTFQDEAQARTVLLFPGAERLSDPTTAQIRAHDFEEGYFQSLRMISLAGMVGQSRAIEAVMEKQPNAEALRLAFSDYLDKRWLNQLPPVPPATPQPPRRYWGAR